MGNSNGAGSSVVAAAVLHIAAHDQKPPIVSPPSERAPHGGYKCAPVGKRFGRWLVLGSGEKRGPRYTWRVGCDCGRVVERCAQSIASGRSGQCQACQAQDAAAVRALPVPSRVGGVQRPEYKTWSAMLARCYDPTEDYYYRYGGRGIAMCDAWRTSFAAFFRDVGERPGPGYSIERIDNDGDYAPGNVRWATAKEQARNTRRNRNIEIDGRTQCVAAWAEELGVRPQLIFKRLGIGWSERDAVLTPVGGSR